MPKKRTSAPTANLGFEETEDKRPPRLPLLGQRVGNYVVTSLIGRGGMGSVYQAQHPEIGRKVAIKFLSAELARMPKIVERFIAEAQAMAAVEHPNVIDIYDFGRMDNGRAYAVMELLKGRELSSLLVSKGKWTAEELLPLLRQICGGLHAAHKQGIVHRDLKPENIFVLDRRDQVKVLDFGIAKILESSASPSHTTPGTVMGTPLVIAPEQAAGDSRNVGPWTDIYSLGVIIYWMLSGRPPFVDKASGVLLAKHILNEPPPLEQVEAGVPPGIAELVNQCLRKKASERPDSAREIAERFAEAVGLEPEALPGFAPEDRTPVVDVELPAPDPNLLPIEAASTMGSGQLSLPMPPGEERPRARVEQETLLESSSPPQEPTGPPQDTTGPPQETIGPPPAVRDSTEEPPLHFRDDSQTLMRLVHRRRGIWFALLGVMLLGGAVAAYRWWPRPQPVAALDSGPTEDVADAVGPGAAPPPAPDLSPDRARPAPSPDIGPGKVSPDAKRPLRTRERSRTRTRIIRPRSKPDAAETPTPPPEPSKVGEGTLDPFGDVKPRR